MKIKERFLKSHKFNRLQTLAYSILFPSREARIAFVFGCQRSGTTLLRNFIGLDPRFLDIGEGDSPYFHQSGGRYLSLVDDDDLQNLVSRQRSPWVLLKPLHDSQRAANLLARFEGARGIWIFRHYSEVIQSHLSYYKHDHNAYLQPLRDLDQSSWILAGLEESQIQRLDELLGFAGDDLSNLYAAFWWGRNAFLFQHLKSSSLCVIGYDDLVRKPQQCLKKFSGLFDLRLANRALLLPVHKKSLVSACTLQPSIREACEEMFKNLQEVSRLSV